MNNLKELTKEQHTNAERSLFVKKLLKKEITAYQYYVYLSNQFLMYTSLEGYASDAGVFVGIEEIKRGNSISKDLQELEREYGFEIPVHLKSTGKYMRYIQSISEDSEKLLAHIYVRHMGDLSGGQIIKRFVPGSGNHYMFESDPEMLKEKVRAKLHNGLAEEAKLCFDMISEFMKELEISLDMAKTN
jgi:heme oxygenase (biliverdin-producing, ferredoxin)